MSKGPKMKNLNERSVRILASLGLIPDDHDLGFCLRCDEEFRGSDPADVSSGDPFFHVCGSCLPCYFIKICSQRTARTILCGAILGIFLCLSYQFQTLRSEIHDGQQNAFITTPVCDHCTVFLLDRQQKETDRAKYRCSVYRSHRSRTFYLCRATSRSISEIF